ncbi:MAG: carboxypeptidase regulatory-like domain-containing protein [Holophagaceae bacterium]|nr:carboxypeptidase regulatory-like domain-containing protein [Holophagaceae bacterium]
MRSRHLSSSSLVALLVAAAPLMAQGVSAQLGGRVLDTKGSAVAGATVVIRNGETGLTRTLQTSNEGRYMATLLPVGPYTVTVTKAGFQTAANIKVNLNLGDAAPLTIKLAPESGAVVEVVAASAQVDSERASAAAIVSPDNLTNLPVFNRNFTNLATLAPQVVVDSNRGNLAIAGQRGVNTSINIDGGDNNEPFFGGATGAAEGKTPFTISIEAIREYQVITDGASAEFGRMGGGYVNAITKNGTNDLSGSLFYYLRPRKAVEAGPTLRQPNGSTTTYPVGDFQHEQFGFSLGGPIVKDKLFYFVAYDAQRRKSPINQGGGWHFHRPSPLIRWPSQANDAVAHRQGRQLPPCPRDSTPTSFAWTGTGSTDHNIQFRVNHSDFKGVTGAGTTAAYENLASDLVKTDAYVLQWNWVIGANWINEFRMSQTKDDMPRSTFSTMPEVAISNVGYYGAYPFDPRLRHQAHPDPGQHQLRHANLPGEGGHRPEQHRCGRVLRRQLAGGLQFQQPGQFPGRQLVLLPAEFRPQQQRQGCGAVRHQLRKSSRRLSSSPIGALSDTFKLGLGLRWDRQENPDFPSWT